MNSEFDPRHISSPKRRSFLTRVNGGFGAIAAMTGLSFAQKASAQEKARESGRFQPAMHEKDEWLDQLPGKHRVVFDTTNFEGLGNAIWFTNNYLRVNAAEYGVNDVAVVIVVRHVSTPFGYNDGMWAKYGAPLGMRTKTEDPKTKTSPKVNLYNAAGYDNLLGNRGVTLEQLAQRGVHIAVCSSATFGMASGIAADTHAETNAIYKELTMNLVSNARMVPAGIVTVTRAQERGYSLVTV